MDAWTDVFRDFFLMLSSLATGTWIYYFCTPIHYFIYLDRCSSKSSERFYICFTSCCHKLEASCGSRIFHFLGRFWAPTSSSSSVKVAVVLCLLHLEDTSKELSKTPPRAHHSRNQKEFFFFFFYLTNDFHPMISQTQSVSIIYFIIVFWGGLHLKTKQGTTHFVNGCSICAEFKVGIPPLQLQRIM
jgi:hypothetical protein